MSPDRSDSGPCLLAAAVLLAAAGLAGCKPAGRPDILLVTIDTVRADHCSAYGYSRPTTPRLERLAAGGIRIDAAYAPMATTGPSHATMFTALLPRSHGVVKNGYVLEPRFETLAEVLRGAGYRTAAVVGSFAVDARFGLDQGFDHYDADFSGDRPTMKAGVWEGEEVPGAFDRRADETREHAVAWLEDNGYLRRGGRGPDDAPFFLWVHFFDPHAPYDPPEEDAAALPAEGSGGLQRLIASYDAEIHFADREMGEVLDALAAAGRLDDTLVVVAGDHGEGLTDHGHMHHGLMIYEEAVRVPFVFHWPARLAAGGSVTAPVPLNDLTPTVLDLAGVVVPEPVRGAWEGQSQAAVLLGDRAADPLRRIFLQRRLYEDGKAGNIPVLGEKHGLRLGKWSYLEALEEKTEELFDLETDPRQLRNLRDERPEEATSLAEILRAWVETGTPGRQQMSEEDVLRLRSLGYVQ